MAGAERCRGSLERDPDRQSLAGASDPKRSQSCGRYGPTHSTDRRRGASAGDQAALRTRASAGCSPCDRSEDLRGAEISCRRFGHIRISAAASALTVPRRAANPFATVRSEGALLPPDLLRRIADSDRSLGGLSPTDYHLGPNERLTEAVSRSWNRLIGLWSAFSPTVDRLTNLAEAGTGPTRERWLLPLFFELGFGRLPLAKSELIDAKPYPISHRSNEGIPIHLVGAGIDLDRRTAGVVGAAKMSPHGLVQSLLNRTPSLWGIVSNGRRLRLLRDNASLTRQAYVEFDLERMMGGEAYADFALLWLVCHQSRFEAESPADCWLERWFADTRRQGTRAMDNLRNGVERGLNALGAGFLAEPSNGGLRGRLRSREFSTEDYYRQLLRLVYRMIFLFVADDRDLLHPPDASHQARSLYRNFYS